MARVERDNEDLHELNDIIITDEPRRYLGLSQVGEPCLRKLQYHHYFASKKHHSKRIRRLFNVGHSAEKLMTKDLESIGIIVTGDQTEVIGVSGHWKGHIDGAGTKDSDPEEFLVEYKTHNDKSFKVLKKDKVFKSKPVHYAQVQAYMGYMEFKKCLYMALNKNDSEYYIEWIYFDEEYFKELKRKQLEVITAETLLPRIGNNSKSWFECKRCDEAPVCFRDKPIAKTCRSCVNVDVLSQGDWFCSKFESLLTVEEQRVGCEDYKIERMFIEDD